MKRLLTLSLAALLAAALTGCGARGAKPVIYLYPEEETQVSVTLELDGRSPPPTRTTGTAGR